MELWEKGDESALLFIAHQLANLSANTRTHTDRQTDRHKLGREREKKRNLLTQQQRTQTHFNFSAVSASIPGYLCLVLRSPLLGTYLPPISILSDRLPSSGPRFPAPVLHHNPPHSFAVLFFFFSLSLSSTLCLISVKRMRLTLLILLFPTTTSWKILVFT